MSVPIGSNSALQTPSLAEREASVALEQLVACLRKNNHHTDADRIAKVRVRSHTAARIADSSKKLCSQLKDETDSKAVHKALGRLLQENPEYYRQLLKEIESLQKEVAEAHRSRDELKRQKKEASIELKAAEEKTGLLRQLTEVRQQRGMDLEQNSRFLRSHFRKQETAVEAIKQSLDKTSEVMAKSGETCVELNERVRRLLQAQEEALEFNERQLRLASEEQEELDAMGAFNEDMEKRIRGTDEKIEAWKRDAVASTSSNTAASSSSASSSDPSSSRMEVERSGLLESFLRTEEAPPKKTGTASGAGEEYEAKRRRITPPGSPSTPRAEGSSEPVERASGPLTFSAEASPATQSNVSPARSSGSSSSDEQADSPPKNQPKPKKRNSPDSG